MLATATNELFSQERNKAPVRHAHVRHRVRPESVRRLRIIATARISGLTGVGSHWPASNTERGSPGQLHHDCLLGRLAVEQ